MAAAKEKDAGFTLRWRNRWKKGYHTDLLLWVMMDYFIDFANWKTTRPYIKGYGRVEIKRGQHLFGTQKLANFFNTSRRKIRLSLERLEKTGFMSIETTNRFSIATIINYETYQQWAGTDGHQNGQQTANRRPTDGHQNGQQTAIPKELNTLKEDKEIDINVVDTIENIIKHLNKKTGSKFKHNNYITQGLILDRINEGATEADLIAVIDVKVKQWIDDKKMAGNLRPGTLFAAEYFEGYLQEANRNGDNKPPQRQINIIDLLQLGYNILDKFGQAKFNDWCIENKLQENDKQSIMETYQRAQK